MNMMPAFTGAGAFSALMGIANVAMKIPILLDEATVRDANAKDENNKNSQPAKDEFQPSPRETDIHLRAAQRIR